MNVNNLHPRVVDALIAAAIAVVVLLVVAGLATALVVAAVALAACGVSVLIDRRRARHAGLHLRRRSR